MGILWNPENCRLGLVPEKHLATCSWLKQPDLISAEFNADSFEPTGYTQSRKSDVVTGVIYLIYIIKIYYY